MNTAPSAQSPGDLVLRQNQDKKREDLLKDLVLSLKQDQDGVPTLLMYAPVTIRYLGHLRFMAYKPGVLSLHITPKEQSKIKYPSLTSAIEQLVLLSNKAFHLASSNMKQMTAILGMLQDPEYARTSLEPTLLELEEGIDQCKNDVQAIAANFKDLLEFTEEIFLLVSDKSSSTSKQFDKVKRSRDEAQRQQQRNTEKAAKLQKEVDKLMKREDEAHDEVRQSLRNNEWKMFGLKLAGDLTDVVFGTVNEALNAPRLAGQIVESITRIRRPGAEPLTKVQAPPPSNDKAGYAPSTQRQDGPSEMDGALAAADSIVSQVKLLQSLIEDNLYQRLQEDGGEEAIGSCVTGLRGELDRLEESRGSRPVIEARLLLREAMQVGSDILERGQDLARQLGGQSQEFSDKLAKWTASASQAARKADKLMTLAVNQPGQAYGNHSSKLGSDTSTKQSTLLLRERQNKLEARRQALERAREDLERKTTSCERAMDQALALAEDATRLNASANSLEELLKVLAGAVTVISSFQDEMQKIVDYFDNMRMVIEKFGLSYARRFALTIRSGREQGDEKKMELVFGPHQALTIRETVLQLRGLFTLLIDESRLYRTVYQESIQPCQTAVSRLRMGDITAEEERAAKDNLDKMTEEAKKKIAAMAAERNAQMYKDLGGRIEETVEELDKLRIENRLPEVTQETKEAIQEATQEAAKQGITREEERLAQFHEPLYRLSDEDIGDM